MLNHEQLYCGVYDSLISQKNRTRSPIRTVSQYELELYHTDSGVSYIDNRAYPVRRGMLVCAKPGQQRYSRLPIRSSYLWIKPGSDLTWVLDKIPACFYIEEDETVEALLQLFTRLHSYTAGADWSAERAVESNRLLLEILKILLGMCREGDKPQPVNHIIRQAYRYMDRHYCENCPLSKIAEAVHLSANHLHQMFLKSEGCTPYEYVMGKRIEKAKTFILTGDRSLAQIALETGFCSQSHFTAIFKKHTGQTPAQYRTQLFSFS